MTLTRFVTKNAFRNKRRSVLTVASIGFSLLLLTVMMTIWHAFYMSEGSAESAQRLITRHKVSLGFFLPAYYGEKIRALPGVKQVVNESWFGGSIRTTSRQISLRSSAQIRRDSCKSIRSSACLMTNWKRGNETAQAALWTLNWPGNTAGK